MFKNYSFVLSMVLGMLSIAAPALAQERCIQKAGGLPGYPSQAPRWWSDPAPQGESGTRWIDDPRWRGASAVGSETQVYPFRGLVEEVAGQNYFVMMWHVRAAPVLESGINKNRLYFGFYDEASKAGNIYRLDLQPTASTGINGTTHAASGYAGRAYHRTGPGPWLFTSGGLVPPLPDWLKNDARVDIFCESGPCDEWAVRVRVPVDPAAVVSATNPSGIKLTAGNDYRFFYQVQSTVTDDLTNLSSFPATLDVNAGTPGIQAVETAASTSCTAITGLCLPPDNQWELMEFTPSCVGDISLSSSDVFITAAGNHTIDVNVTNPIKAQPINHGGNKNANAIRARFRLAGWGSAFTDSPGWKEVCAWTDSTDVSGGAATISSGGKWQIGCDYNVPAAEKCAYALPYDSVACATEQRNRDQCVLVELDSANGNGPFFFAPQSVYRNMWVTGASVFRKEATLDIQGMTPLGGGKTKRDLYVYVQTRNMPREYTDNTPPVAARLSKELLTKLTRLKIQLPDGSRTLGKEVVGQLTNAVTEGNLSEADLRTLLPTYMAYVWHDTGLAIGASKIIESQPSFGYMFWHDGGVEGWQHQFAGQTVTKIGNNLYKVVAPDGGKVVVKTNIEAVEPGKAAELPDPVDPQRPTDPDHEHKHTHGEVPPHKHSCGCDIPGKERGGSGLLLLGFLLLTAAGVRRKWGADA